MALSSCLATYVARCIASLAASECGMCVCDLCEGCRAWWAVDAWMTRLYAALPAVTCIASAALACLALAHVDVLAERAADHMLTRSLRRVGLGRCDAAGWVFPASYESAMAMLHEKHTDT